MKDRIVIAGIASLLFCGCVPRGFVEATYNHLNQVAALNHAEYQQERNRVSGGGGIFR